jgi:hypothetical protein
MNNRTVCNIIVKNIRDNTTWEHRRVPENHVGTLNMSPNLKVEIIKRFHVFHNDRDKSTGRSPDSGNSS